MVAEDAFGAQRLQVVDAVDLRGVCVWVCVCVCVCVLWKGGGGEVGAQGEGSM